MSVLIEGMEMPKNCINCAARHGAECWLANCSYIPNFRKERPTWCPLIPIPPHGRLIDQDEYRDEFMNGVYVLCSDDSDNYRANAIIDLFDEAPTVIEAEEET